MTERGDTMDYKTIVLNITERNISRVDDGDNWISFNDDYEAVFKFDEEWAGKVKTALFVQGDDRFKVVLADDKCKLPPFRSGLVRVGVFTDAMTSTPEIFGIKRSIKDFDGETVEPKPDVYAQLIEMIESGMLKGDDGLTPYVGSNNNWWIGEVDTGILARGTDGDDGYTPIKGVDYFDGDAYVVTEQDYEAIAEKSSEKLQPTISDLDNTKVGYSEIVNNQLLLYSDSTKVNLLATLDLPSESVNDVQINGTSIVADGVANIPIAGASKVGLVKISTSNNSGIFLGADGNVQIDPANDTQISARLSISRPINPSHLDYAVKAAMCDGKGAEWTAEEQAMARARIGLPENFELVADIELTEETVVVSINFEKYLRELYVVFSGTATSNGNASITVNFDDGTKREYAPTCPSWMNTSMRHAIAHTRLNQGIIYSEASYGATNKEWMPTSLETNLGGFALLTETQKSIQGIKIISLNSYSWCAGCKFTVYGVRA